MNKVKVSMSDMRQNYYIIGVGYCNAQNLLHYVSPVAYSAGVYGWNCDYYDIDGVVISTGYNYIHSKNIKDDYALIKQYDDMAEFIVCEYSTDYESKRDRVRQLLNDLIKELKTNE